jgi:hypothetical protein
MKAHLCAIKKKSEATLHPKKNLSAELIKTPVILSLSKDFLFEGKSPSKQLNTIPTQLHQLLLLHGAQ